MERSQRTSQKTSSGFYQATVTEAEKALADLRAGMGQKKYPYNIAPSWRTAWQEVIPFLRLPTEQCAKSFYTDNAIVKA